MTLTGLVFDIRRYSIHDGPGIRSVVFLKGCPLRCWWCHNPEGQGSRVDMMVFENRCIQCGSCVEICPEGAITWDSNQPVTHWELCQRCGTCIKSCYSGARQQLGQRLTVDQVMPQLLRDTPFYDESGGGVTLSGGNHWSRLVLHSRCFMPAGRMASTRLSIPVVTLPGRSLRGCSRMSTCGYMT